MLSVEVMKTPDWRMRYDRLKRVIVQVGALRIGAYLERVVTVSKGAGRDSISDQMHINAFLDELKS